jgi:hypothetical protein
MKPVRRAAPGAGNERATAGAELREVILAIQELTPEIAQLRHQKQAGPELEAKDQSLEQSRWRLATIARRLATDDLGAAV